MNFFPNAKNLLEINIGGFHLAIAWYAVLILSGSLLVYWLSLRNAKKIGYGKELLEDYFLMLMPLVILGARIWYVIFEWERYQSDIMSVLYVWEGGLAFHGGVVMGIVFSFFYFRKKGVNILRIGDCIMPNLLIGQMIGRWGNFVNQEAYGEVVSESYYNHFPAFIKENMFIDGQYHQPTFLFEGIGNVIGFILITLVYRRFGRKKQGDLIYAYIVWYGFVRFFVEAFRTDSLMFMGLRTAQVTSIVFIVAGVLGILGVYNKVFQHVYPFKYEKPVIVFDLDGTILDSQALIEDSFLHTFKTCKPEYELSEEELDSFVGPALHETFAAYFDEDKVKEVVDVYRDYNHAKHDECIHAMPHAVEVLTYLKENGYELALYSNKYKKAVNMGLKKSGLDIFFDVVIGGDEVKKTKPNPEGILKACEELCVSHDDVIYVGDGVVDVQAAKNMGAYSIAFVSNERRREALEATKPCRIIYDLRDIKDIVKENRVWSEFVI